MDSIQEKDIEAILPLKEMEQELTNSIIEEQDPQKAKDKLQMFNFYQTKKNLIRVQKYNELLDRVSEQMLARFRERPGEFSNSDLLQYLQTIQNTVDKSIKYVNEVDTAPIININQLNIKQEEELLDRESREKVADALKAIMSFMEKQDQEIIEPDSITIEDKIEKGESLLNGDERDNND